MPKPRQRATHPRVAPTPAITPIPDGEVGTHDSVPTSGHTNDPHGTVAMLLMVLCMLLLMFLVIAIAQSA